MGTGFHPARLVHILEEWHFRVLHRPAEAPPFLISDFACGSSRWGGADPPHTYSR